MKLRSKKQTIYFVSWFDIKEMSIGNSVLNIDCDLHGVELVCEIVKRIEERISENTVVLTFQAV